MICESGKDPPRVAPFVQTPPHMILSSIPTPNPGVPARPSHPLNSVSFYSLFP